LDWKDHIAAAVRGSTERDVPLAPRASMRVGGAAELVARPADVPDLVALLRAARETDRPVTVLGGGCNTIVGDGGVPGVVLRLPAGLPEKPGGDGEQAEDRGDSIRVELSAGAPSARLLQRARELCVVGAGWSAGIPGTVGGLAAMNAGTAAGEMKGCLVQALLCGPDGAEWMDAAALRMGYRTCDTGGRVIARIRADLHRGSAEELRAERAAVEADLAKRRRTQPLQYPNSGCAFRNPPGDHAGRIVESLGLKGLREGGAQVSELHANFVVNRGGATARDVATLLATVQTAVRDRLKILLALELRLVGIFAPPPEVLGLVLDRQLLQEKLLDE